MTIKELKSIYEEYRDLSFATQISSNNTLLYKIATKRMEILKNSLDAHEHLLYINANILKKNIDQAFKNVGLKYCSLVFDKVTVAIKEDDDSANVYSNYAEIAIKIYGRIVTLQQCNLVDVDIDEFYAGKFSIPMIEFLDNIYTDDPKLANAMELIYNAVWDTLKEIFSEKNKGLIAKNIATKKIYTATLSQHIQDKNTLDELERLIRKQINIEKENIKLSDEDILLS